MNAAVKTMLFAGVLALCACRREPPPSPAKVEAQLPAPANATPPSADTIHDAVLGHDLGRVKELLAANPALVNARNEKGDTPLYIAAFRGYKVMVDFLLRNRADPNPPPNNRGETPLSIAVELNLRQTAEMIRKAGGRDDDLVRGAAIRAATLRRKPEALAPLLAPRPDLVDARNAYGQTSLYLAAATGDTNTASVLLNLKASPNATNLGGGTPYSAACERGEPTMIVLLRAAGGRENKITETTPIRLAARKGLLADVKEILQKSPESVMARDDWQHTPLHEAAGSGSPAVVELLLQLKADPNARDFADATPLHVAAAAGDEAVVRLLLDHGADINARNRQRSTPLHLATGRGKAAAAKLLLDRGADFLARDNTGGLPLHMAALNGDPRTVELLLDRGVDPNAPDRPGNTALHIAVLRLHPEVVKLLLARHAAPSPKDNTGRTPLAIATQNKLEEITKLLRDAGAKE